MNLEKHTIQNFSLFGLKATSFNTESLEQYFCETVWGRRQIVCYGYSLTILPRFRTMPQIYHIAETFDVMVADGKGFYYLCKIFGRALDSDWALYEITDALLALAERENFSIMLLGADAESNRTATENLQKTYPAAKILEGIHGYFSAEDEPSVVEQVNQRNPDILMIGISSPKKEEFVWRNRKKLNTRIVVLMGGVIDIYAGKTKPIPVIAKKLCLSWLYRFVQEPIRTRCIVLNGLEVLFRLIPAMAWAYWIKKDSAFSIPAFYGVDQESEA